ncbi:HAD family hydrolase [Desulfatibacillum aliphaticivorans]|uniref:HAD family hydrolase n=1 Tax=Desulfatibacillum aliphaticivorans TaxID=218208 RepID=UPI000404E8B0|nr:HAD family hydrolase [Desulfatibacillum aliphaticivorans]
MQYKAVIFDLDGTLLNTLDDLADSANRALAARGFPTYTVDEYKYFIGDGAEMLVRRALPEGAQDDDAVFGVLDAFKEDYSRNWNVKTRIYEGVNDLLTAVDGMGVRKAILSNKPHEYTLLCVEEYFAPGTFEMVLGMRPEVPKKPDPAGAFEIVQSLSLKPEECVFLGDSSTDIHTAKNANMLAVGALWGFRTADELTQAGAQVEIRTPMELMNHLKR